MAEIIYFVLMIISFALGYWARGYHPSSSASSGESGDHADWWKKGEEPPEYGQ